MVIFEKRKLKATNKPTRNILPFICPDNRHMRRENVSNALDEWIYYYPVGFTKSRAVLQSIQEKESVFMNVH